MTPAEHYAEAERVLDACSTPGIKWVRVGGQTWEYNRALRYAQVHATLATVGPGDWARRLAPEEGR